MLLEEMHSKFRQFTQQMGLQNLRAILPEQIDSFLNTSITDKVNQIIKDNIANTNDRVISDNSKLDQINGLRTLYKVANIKFSTTISDTNKVVNFVFCAKDRNIGKISNDFKLSPADISAGFSKGIMPDALYLVDFSLNYRTSVKGLVDFKSKGCYNYEEFDDTALETRLYPIRLIADSVLADSLNDNILKNRLRSPIMVIYNNNTYDLYIDTFKEQSVGADKFYKLTNDLVPYEFRMSYIAKPAVVSYKEDLGGANVECDLPESLHTDIVKHAVDLYHISISGELHAAQQREQAQNQETIRNSAQPYNGGGNNSNGN